MALRDDLKNYIPMYLWEVMNYPEGYKITAEEWNSIWNRIRTQGDAHANWIRDLLLMLYDTVLSDTDGASHIKTDLPAFSSGNLKQVLTLIDQRLVSDAQALATHKTSSDHDGRYYTETELNAGQLDNRYYTETELNSGQLDNRYYTETELNNNQLGNLYYTKSELAPWLRGGDTIIREEVFTIVNPNIGDGTFSYLVGGTEVIGSLLGNGEQVFTLSQGFYEVDSNRLEVIVNDTLRRSVASGGIIEIDDVTFALTSPEGAGAEITAKYYERLGVVAEYNIKLSASKPPANNGKTMWFKITG
jgi:hypothetical protein